MMISNRIPLDELRRMAIGDVTELPVVMPPDRAKYLECLI